LDVGTDSKTTENPMKNTILAAALFIAVPAMALAQTGGSGTGGGTSGAAGAGGASTGSSGNGATTNTGTSKSGMNTGAGSMGPGTGDMNGMSGKSAPGNTNPSR
jgi:hypothetical protein